MLWQVLHLRSFFVLATFILVVLLMRLPLRLVPATFLTVNVPNLNISPLPPLHLLNHVCLLLALEVLLAFVFSLTLIPWM